MLTMTITGSLASTSDSVKAESRKAGTAPVRASGHAAGMAEPVRGSVTSKVQNEESATSGRPVSARRAALLATERGQELAKAARADLGHALAVHGISKVAGLRLTAGMSQKELCAETRIPQPHLSRLENGKVKTPELNTLIAMSKALGVTLEVLVSAFMADTATA